MKFDLSQFKKVHEDLKTATLQHPKGHKITIAKSGLSKKMQGDLANLPHFATGGGTDDAAKAAYLKQNNDENGMPVYPKNKVSPEFNSFLSKALSSQSPDPISSANSDVSNYDALHSKDTSQMSPAEHAQLSDQNSTFYRPQGDPLPANSDPLQPPQSFAGQLGQSFGNSIKDRVGALNDYVYKPIINTGSDFIHGMMGTPASASVDQTASSQSVPKTAPSNYDLSANRNPSGTEPGSNINSSMGGYDMLGDLKKGYDQQQAGINAEANAVGQQGKQDSQTASDFIAKTQQIHQNFQQINDHLMDQQNKFTQDVMNDHIDPKHYWADKSSGSKVMSAIGLVLGGMGGGLTGQENPALKFLQSKMEMDMQAQRDNLGKDQNLMSANLHQLQNNRDAEATTQANLLSVYEAKVRQAASQNQDPMAQARAQQLLGQLQQQKAQILGPVAMRQAAMGVINQGAVDPAMRINLLQKVGIVSPEQGQSAMKELQTKQNMDSTNDDLLKTFDYLAKNNTVLNKLNPQEQKRMSAMVDSKLLKLAHDSAGRFNMEEIPYMKSQFPDATSDQKTIAVKRAEFINGLSSRSHFPSLEPYGVGKWTPKASPGNYR